MTKLMTTHYHVTENLIKNFNLEISNPSNYAPLNIYANDGSYLKIET
ncbi:hypothetical protein PspMM1_18520 [Pseudoalteromonas sp. MM1]|nr:hypothetical protein PspMM1_18520 [Pseudoalteromonas sp. MM1]